MDPLKENGDLYRINYSSIPDENSAELVVARTKVLQSLSTIGKYCYNFFINNCENFATFCKTGFSISYQLEWLKKNAKQAMDLGIDFGNNPSVLRWLYPLRFVLYEGIEALTGAGDVLGAGLLMLGECYSCYKDIAEINAKEGMSEKDRMFEKFNRRCVCSGGMVLGAVGSYVLGQYMGSTLGSLIGGPLGLFADELTASIKRCEKPYTIFFYEYHENNRGVSSSKTMMHTTCLRNRCSVRGLIKSLDFNDCIFQSF
ncbi:uncharacterized protein LOC128217836 isoform X1 [Mya arenaria]|uniref:uncharacterized protein LOC128217836 isoform X1 n=1 Tax=Mya arenaria TaxID=6604 RepID=UPI0022E5E3A5|nr:uncharacterized protein LOC128217836 isoform X1 [Mya arenaria]